jgi:phosphoadenosine phosphosulfate reductase
MPAPLELDVDRVNRHLAGAPPEDVLAWATATFGDDVVASSSFQTQSVPLLHMISRACPGLPVLFLDTGFHFPETLAFRDRVVAQFGLNLQVLHCRIEREAFMRCYGPLYRSDPDLCCYLNKVEPLARALAGRGAWIAGIRRDQSTARRATRVLERGGDLVYKLSPLADWSASQVEDYVRMNDLPVHPLTLAGYASIGCKPCTRAVAPGADPRAGRWSDRGKTECGLHEDHWRRRAEPGPST